MTETKKLTLPLLELDLQKTTIFVTRPFRLTQGDKGYYQPFHLSVGFQPYDVTADTLCFSALKPDGQFIEVENEPERFSYDMGTWYFQIPEALAQAVGTITGFFYIKQGDSVVASTTKFAYEITARFGDDEASNSYVTMLEDIKSKLSQELEGVRANANQFQQFVNRSDSDLTATIQDLKRRTDSWLSSKTSEVDGQIQSRTVALDALQRQWNQKYNELVSQFNNQLTAQQSSWSTQLGTQQSKWQAQFDSQNQQFITQKSKIDSDYQAKLASLKSSWDEKFHTAINGYSSSFDSFKQELSQKIDTAKQLLDNISDTKVPELQAKIDALNSKVRDVDFNSFVKSVNGVSAVNGNVSLDLYSKSEIDSKISEAGKVKTVQGQQPDNNGNVQLQNVRVALGFSPTTGDAQTALETYGNYQPVDRSAIVNLVKIGLPGVYAKKTDLDSLGKVKTVNGSGPDGSGNVTVSIPDVSHLIDSAIQKIHFKYEEASGSTSDSIIFLDITANKDDSGNYIIDAQGPAYTARNVTMLRTTVNNMNGQISALQTQISALQTQMQSTAKIQTLTQAEYDALAKKDDKVIYRIKG